MNSYLRRQAELLLAMSRQTFDLGIAGRLRNLASEFQREAEKPEPSAKDGSPYCEPID
jgi:hypothetical protein